MKINIAKKDKAEVLVALYNPAKKGTRDCMFFDPRDLELEEARKLLEKSPKFSCLMGRFLEIDLSGDYLDADAYDKINGEGTAAKLIANVRDIN